MKTSYLPCFYSFQHKSCLQRPFSVFAGMRLDHSVQAACPAYLTQVRHEKRKRQSENCRIECSSESSQCRLFHGLFLLRHLLDRINTQRYGEYHAKHCNQRLAA